MFDIKIGTFLAITTTSSVYAILIIFLGCTITPFASGVFQEMQNYPQQLNCSMYGSNGMCPYGLIQDYQV
jgi:hypothetical protein